MFYSRINASQYDDLVGLPATGEVPVGTYKNIVYNSWILRPDNTSLVGGYAPHSPPNTILSPGLVQATNGTPTFTVAPPYISVGFKSFYFACDLQTREDVVSAQSLPFAPISAFPRSLVHCYAVCIALHSTYLQAT